MQLKMEHLEKEKKQKNVNEADGKDGKPGENGENKQGLKTALKKKLSSKNLEARNTDIKEWRRITDTLNGMRGNGNGKSNGKKDEEEEEEAMRVLVRVSDEDLEKILKTADGKKTEIVRIIKKMKSFREVGFADAVGGDVENVQEEEDDVEEESSNNSDLVNNTPEVNDSLDTRDDGGKSCSSPPLFSPQPHPLPSPEMDAEEEKKRMAIREKMKALGLLGFENKTKPKISEADDQNDRNDLIDDADDKRSARFGGEKDSRSVPYNQEVSG